jgi:hypothetical protein
LPVVAKYCSRNSKWREKGKAARLIKRVAIASGGQAE